MDFQRTAGSVKEFDLEWQRTLENGATRHLIFPSLETGRQFDFFEWVKARQILSILSQAGVYQGNVLEYGCGAAGTSLFLADHGYHSHICDISTYALKIAQINQKSHYPQIKYSSITTANALQLPYAANTFDIVMSFGLLEHFEIDVLHKLLDETTRILAPGGFFIADIIPGPERMNVRTAGIAASYLGSASYRIVTGRWSQLRSLHDDYFELLFESKHDDRAWARILAHHELAEIKVNVCRPFPPLALPGKLETRYTRIMQRCLNFHERFDRANNWLTRRWGWMYLVSSRKPL
jgi:SAM-dependent methyltransferase